MPATGVRRDGTVLNTFQPVVIREDVLCALYLGFNEQQVRRAEEEVEKCGSHLPLISISPKTRNTFSLGATKSLLGAGNPEPSLGESGVREGILQEPRPAQRTVALGKSLGVQVDRGASGPDLFTLQFVLVQSS